MSVRTQTTDGHLSRRTVAAAALWSAPVIALSGAAPAMAVTKCGPATYDANFTTSTYARSSSTSGRLTASAAGRDPVTVTVASTAVGGKLIGAGSLSVAGDTQAGYNGVGDLRSDGLMLQQSGGTGGNSSRQTVTFTFDRPVSGLSFVLADLDRKGSGTSGAGFYHDAVAVTPTPQVVNAANVTGSATTVNPLRSSNVAEVSADNTAHRSNVSIAGPVTSFTLQFWSATGTDGQQVFLRDLVFTASGCRA